MNSSIIKKGTKKTPLTAADVFNAVVQRIKDKGAYPDNMEYAISERPDYAVPITTDEYTVRSNLDWGGSEGIYLDIKIEFQDGDNRIRLASAGTFKTLESDNNAMYYMAKLLADYLIEDYEFRRENRIAFEFEGYWIDFYDQDERKGNYSVWYKDKKDAVSEAEKMLKKYPKVTITECATDQVELLEAAKDPEE